MLGDVPPPDDVLRAARGCTAICHLAAIADVAQVHDEPADATELNATGTLNVLEAARQLSTRRVVYASTVWVYSDVDADEVDEDTLLCPPAHLYTAGKLAGELYCRSYAALYGVESTIVRFGIPYGPRARPAAVIPSFVARARAGEPLTIAGTGDQQRAFVYVEDLAEGVVRALAPAAPAGPTTSRGARPSRSAAWPRSSAPRWRRSRSSTPRAVRPTCAARRSAATAAELAGVGTSSPRRATRYADWVAASPSSASRRR